MKQSVRDIDVNNKKVLVRVDFNVPIDRNGAIADDGRIRAAIPTIQYLQTNGAAIILCSHFGRPDGKVVESMRLNHVADRLSELLNQPVRKLDDCIGTQVEAEVAALQPREIILLENLRFHPEEEKNDPEFSRK